MIKMFCDVCGKPGGVLNLEVFKTANEKKIVLEIEAWNWADEQKKRARAHICDPCAIDLLQDAVTTLNVRIATVVHQSEPPL